MRRILLAILKFALACLVILYAGDWAILRVRMQRQTAFGTVQVDRFLATPLKGHKEEFDYMGVTAQSCARSIFPHGSDPPCWWLERHTRQWEE